MTGPVSGQQQSQDLSSAGWGWICPGSSQGMWHSWAAGPTLVSPRWPLKEAQVSGVASLPPCLLLSSRQGAHRAPTEMLV